MSAAEAPALQEAPSTGGAARIPLPRDPLRAAMRLNLHPQQDVHSSWWPSDWPAAHRRAGALGPQAQALLAQWLHRRFAAAPNDYRFDTPLRRLALLDGPSLRRLAAYVGLAVHRPVFLQRGVGRRLLRHARRLDTDADGFILERVPALPALGMNHAPLLTRPAGAGRIIFDRGHRLLAALLQEIDEPLRAAAQRKLPRRAAALATPSLASPQRQQLEELTFMCLIPERLGSWDWLF